MTVVWPYQLTRCSLNSLSSPVCGEVRELLEQSHGNIYYHVQSAVDRVVLNAVLEHVKGNQVEAAERLGNEAIFYLIGERNDKEIAWHGRSL